MTNIIFIDSLAVSTVISKLLNTNKNLLSSFSLYEAVCSNYNSDGQRGDRSLQQKAVVMMMFLTFFI